MKVALIRVDDIPSEGVAHIDFFGRDVVVLKVDGRPKAIVNVCLHLGGVKCQLDLPANDH